MKFNKQQMNNAKYIYNFFLSRGWTPQSICGMIGNMQTESYLYADIWEGGNRPGTGTGPGYGLVQWTPASKLINWCKERGLDYTKISSQCARIQYEMSSGIQFYPSAAYSMTSKQFMKSTESAYTLGLIFLANYERPKNPNQPHRGKQATYWYNKLAEKHEFLEPEYRNNTYIVQSGDTLAAIADRFGVTTSQLKTWNDINNIDLINIGQVLEVENNSGINPSSNMYEVKSGDTLTGIARKFKVSVSQLKNWNNIDNADLIQVGQILKVNSSS